MHVYTLYEYCKENEYHEKKKNKQTKTNTQESLQEYRLYIMIHSEPDLKVMSSIYL